MKVIKLPRTFKKKLKKQSLKQTGNPDWKTSELKIYGYDKKRKKISSLTLGIKTPKRMR